MKQRLTITLSDSTLAKIDHLIDKKEIRNRSHAIEFILEKTLKPRIQTAIILAGGAQDTDTAFRPLHNLHDKPLIKYQLEHLKKYGVTRVIIATNEAGKSLEKLLGNGKADGLELKYLYETEPLGTAGAVKAAAQKNGTEPFFVIAGDVLTTINLDDLASFHTKHQSVVTMAVKPRITKESYDNVFIQGHTVVDFQKSKPDQTVSLVNAGVYLFEPEALKYIPHKTPATLERDVFPILTSSQKLLAFPFQGIWFDITSDTNYEEAIKGLS